MTQSVELKRVTMVYGPNDDPHMYELFEGVLYERSYFFYLEHGILYLRHVRKVEQPDHPQLYVDGESGGLQLAENVQREIMEVVTELIERLCSKNGLAFLLDELLWLHGRSHIELNLVKTKGNL
ncbi:hypothetical protein [Paenibacillus sp. NPDC055715]